MRRFALLLLLPSITVGAGPTNRLTPAEEREGYTLLFNGKDLSGWSGDPHVWGVEDWSIVGTTDKHKIEQNTFLVYDRPVADFHLKAEVLLRNGNSGIQFRSKVHPGPGWIVGGYQADFSDAGERSAWGNFYEERGRRRGLMRTEDEGWRAAKAHVRLKDWNLIEVRAEGPRIRIWLNGEQTIDALDEKAPTGVLALQLHSGEPMRVEFRNLKMKVLHTREAAR
jgi:hypothetical protein